MPKTLQLRRGSTSTLSGITPAAGELLVDTDKNTVTVGNGSTAGGNPLATNSQLGAAFGQANAAFGVANTNTTNIATIQGVDNTQNTNITTATTNAQAAFDAANTKLSSSGGTISGNLTVSQDLSVTGNLFIAGNTTSITANNISINDPLIYIAQGNPANLNDLGLVGHFTSDHYQHTGIVRDHSDGSWKFFSNVSTEPTSTVNFAEANTIYDSIKVGGITSPTATINGVELGAYSTAAYGKANSANVLAQAAFGVANTATTNITTIQGVDNTQNTSITAAFNAANGAVAVNTTQNTSITAAFAQANAAFSAANTKGTGTVTSVATGTGLTGGTITSTGTISLATTSVSSGSYTNTNLTVDSYGRITSASNGDPTDSVARNNANLAFGRANAAFAVANTINGDFLSLTTGGSVGGSIRVTSGGLLSVNGVYTSSTFQTGNWLGDGIIMDYTTGTGRFTVGASDGFAFRNNLDSGSPSTLVSITNGGDLTAVGNVALSNVLTMPGFQTYTGTITLGANTNQQLVDTANTLVWGSSKYRMNLTDGTNVQYLEVLALNKGSGPLVIANTYSSTPLVSAYAVAVSGNNTLMFLLSPLSSANTVTAQYVKELIAVPPAAIAASLLPTDLNTGTTSVDLNASASGIDLNT